MFLLSVRDASYKINRMVMGENSRHAEFAVISPSSTLTLKFREILEKRGLDCIVIQASQMDAPEVVSRLKDNGVKIFISRGNTAKILKKIVGITVIEARHTFFDCYYSYKNARKISDRIAFLATSVGYKDILDKCCPFMPDVVIFPLEPENGEAYIKTELGKLHDMGIEVAIGGLSLKPFVEAMGIRYVMTEADDDEVNDAIDEAMYQLNIEHEREKRSEELEKRYVTIQTIMDSVSECIIRVDEHGIITDFNDYAVNLLPRIRKNLELSTIFPNCSSIVTACMEGKHVNDEVVEDKEAGYLILSVNPVSLDYKTAGAVITMQRQQEIQNRDEKIRKRLLARGYSAVFTFPSILGRSTLISDAKRIAKRYAEVDSTVLLSGETGTGKEMFAQSIHNASSRRNSPFVAINCASLPSSILESELFGYVKGAFTGAKDEGKPGIFELAHNGTIFLDEISEASPDIQMRLLRVIQERQVVRLGDDRVINVDVRIIAATNKNLKMLVQEGKFRADLFYRICVLVLVIPSLSERREDIPILVDAFAKRFGQNITMTEAAMDILKGYSWPGNVRELLNVVERMAVTCEGGIITEEIAEKALYGFLHSRSNRPSSDKEAIQLALKAADGNKAEAARMLGMSKTTFWRRLQEIEGKYS